MAINNHSINVIGLMSGTSLDGMDIAYVSFIRSEKIEFDLIHSETIPFSKEWKQKLSQAFHSTPDELIKLDASFGVWIGNAVLHFIKSYQIKPDLIASHGHTIFHKPNLRFTLQIGSGKMIRDLTHIPVINNFRVQDVALGGQGAPLVPIGDELLFPEYDFCLNLGGFSNVSWKEKGKRLACDIGPCNILLNEICKRISMEYDKNGKLAETGKIITSLLDKWNELEFYKLQAPKSLSREWFEMYFLKDIQKVLFEVNDLLAAAIEHTVLQINEFLEKTINQLDQDALKSNYKILVTGGGTHNSYLMKKLQTLGANRIQYIIPDKNIVDFKEAIVFALLGYLRWNNEINVLASVTGAKRDHSSGEVYKLDMRSEL